MRKIGKFIGTILVIGLILAVIYLVKNPDVREGVVAVFDGQSITWEDVENYRAMASVTNGDGEAMSTKDIILQIVEDIVLRGEAEKQKLTATQEEIEAFIEGVEQAYAMADGKEAMDKYFEEAGIDYTQYIQMLREKAPGIIAKEKLMKKAQKEYCEENGLTYTPGTTTEEIVEAQKKYIESLIKEKLPQISFFLDGE